MPVYNEHVKANRKAGTYGRGEFMQVCADTVSFVKPVDTSDGSVYRLGSYPTDWILTSALISNDALAGCTSVDLGAYGTDGGAVINKNVLMSAASLAAAQRRVDATTNVSIANMGTASLGELLGFTPKTSPAQVDLALTLNTAGAATGSINVHLSFRRR